MNPRVRTGIGELDKMLEGGFMQGDAVMVAGSAGTGKTTLAMQSLVNGAQKFGEGGIYITFEQLPDQLYRDALGFGWDLRKLEEDGRLRLICTSPDIILEGGSEPLLEEAIKDINAKRIVIDSLSHLQMFVKEDQLRLESYRLLMYFKARGLSSTLLWEMPQMFGQSFSVTETGLSFLVDTIVLMKQIEIESSIRRALVVLKMRGSEHDKHFREYNITKEGIVVSSPFVGYDSIITGTPRRSSVDAATDNWTKAFKREKGRG